MLQKAMIVLLLGVTSLMFSGCVKQTAVAASTPAQKKSHKPIWVDRETALYPSEEYLTGVGSGPTREAAESAAVAAVAKIFKSEINATTSSLQRYEELKIGGRVQEAHDIQLASSVSVATNKVLQDLKIVQRWYDESQQTHYALAAMDRAHSAKLLSARIVEMDRDIQALRQRAESTSDRLEAMRALRKAMKLLLTRTIYNTDLRVINTDASSIDSEVSLTDLQQKIQHYLSNEFRIGVTVTGKNNKQMRNAILEALTKAGFSVEKRKKSSGLDLLVQADASFESADLPRFKFVRWRIELNLIDANTDKVLGGFEREGKEGHTTFSEAEKRAVRAAQKDIVSNIGSELISFIFLDDR